MKDIKKIIGFVNQKGGVGKTTTCVTLAIGLAELLDKKVLLVDLDPQGNASKGIGLDYEKIKEKNIYHSLIGKEDISECIYKTKYKNLDIAPSTIDLAASDMELASVFSREKKLEISLKKIKDEYDFILIDCQPSLSLLTINALNVIEECIVPLQSEVYAIDGVEQLVNTINMVKENLNPNINILGMLFTMLDKRTKLHTEIEANVRKEIPDFLFDQTIPRSINIAEAAKLEKSIFDLKPSSKVSNAYVGLIKEIFTSTEEERKNIDEKILKKIEINKPKSDKEKV